MALRIGSIFHFLFLKVIGALICRIYVKYNRESQITPKLPEYSNRLKNCKSLIKNLSGLAFKVGISGGLEARSDLRR